MYKKYPKIYIGPMSKNIVDSIIGFCEEENECVGLIPSRRQIEYSGGYVYNWKTKEFASYIKTQTSKIMLQRDHGGRLQGSPGCDDLASFREDALSGFNLIHIDPWKKFNSIGELVEETASNIEVCNSANPDCNYEVGTEEAIHKYTSEELDIFLTALQKRLGVELWKKIKFAVIQAGTRIVGTQNVGTFDEERCIQMIEVCRNHGLLSKEHNGDYLSDKQIRLRFSLGLDGLNIAPEFGVDETKLILNELDDNNRDKFYNLCLESARWVKWFPPGFKPGEENKEQIIQASGHYVFSHPEFQEIKNSVPAADKKIKTFFKRKLSNLIKIAHGKNNV